MPKGSAVGAAMTATSTWTSPSWIACQRPPWERSTPSPAILPREQYSPSGPFMLPSMWWTTPRSIRSMTGAWQGNDALGNHRSPRTPSSAAASSAITATRSPLRKWWCVETVMPSRSPTRSSAVRRSGTRLSPFAG